MGVYIPPKSHISQVYLHCFFSSGDLHRVTNQVIPEIPGDAGTYRLVPPAAFDVAWAFTTKDLYVEDAATNAQLVNVYTLEPISGILTLLTDPPYPDNLRVSYRYYGAYVSFRAKDLKHSWPQPPSYPDAYAQQVYPLQKRLPEGIEWRLYGTNINAIKSYIREGVKDNNFFLIIDDNICERTWDSAAPLAFRPGWAAEGPLFCDDIDLVDRGGDPSVLFKLQPHQYGDYYYHTTITPNADLWSGWPGWVWMNSLLTPSVPYGWPPDDWWDPDGPVLLPAISSPPGGYIIWRTNLPSP